MGAVYYSYPLPKYNVGVGVGIFVSNEVEGKDAIAVMLIYKEAARL